GDPFGKSRFVPTGQPDEPGAENISALTLDRAGRIWAGSDAGLEMIDPDTLKIRSFGPEDGVSIRAHYPGAAVQMPNGTLLFGSVGGVNVVQPDNLKKKSTFSAPIVATSVRIAGKTVPPTASLSLPANDHNFQVEFAALDYASPEKIRYAYRLVGFDPDWIQTDSDHRVAAYTNLPPGHYSLLLRSAAQDSTWTNGPPLLELSVLPAWYQTLWFKGALVAAGILSIWGLIRSRTAYLRQRQKALETVVAERTADIASLLHNSGEGFLSCSPNLRVDHQYSRACEIFFGETPAGKDVAALLFAENPRHQAFAVESIPSALACPEPFKRDLILSLLPKEFDRRGRRLKAQYTVLENGHLMVVLRDVTVERRLAERVASENRRLGMIVAAVSDSRDFFDTIDAFRSFAENAQRHLLNQQNPREALRETYRQVHTFKGALNQFGFEKTPSVLHDIEAHLDEMRQPDQELSLPDLVSLFASQDLASVMDQDLLVIRNALGDDFLANRGHMTVTQDHIFEVKRLAALWRQGKPIDTDQPAVSHLLNEIERVGTVSLKTELVSYDKAIAQVALRLDKEVAPLVVEGDVDIWLDPSIYGSFLRSLIHVFQNCVTHGIEVPNVRIDRGKDEQGKIFCMFQRQKDELVLTIADDGAGIDIASLRRIIVEKGLAKSREAETLSDPAVLDFIFHDHVTTAGAADEWSGRGIGLAAVRRETQALGGTVQAETHKGSGTRFVFTIGLREGSIADAA
ncbi:MAG TPA: triple tyrosine motif-containing protein, partial [Magnetospirillaceae bacterium]|nr:triple tyrosine motif-containing protein [Magnetospirillaceae bacterium]